MVDVIYYSVPEIDPDSRYRIGFDGEWDIHDRIDQKYITVECASHYWYRWQGHELSWPVMFALFDSEDGEEIIRLRVGMYYVPEFSVIEGD
ncbi:conserved hypothetical protein [Gammaproteobacteria bacterium]